MPTPKATLILVRHGRSSWNAEGRFTGMVDVPLAPEGWDEARKAGEALAQMKVDAAFSSHLMRAMLTLAVILRENKASGSPIFLPEVGTVPRQSYAPSTGEFPVFLHAVPLAERHYGDLQGKNKDAVRQEFGAEKVHEWRRSFGVPPPNGESLADTCERVLPYFSGEVMPRLTRGETVLIVAHGNSLRALTKHLEGLSEEEILRREIPTGRPIVYRGAVQSGAFVPAGSPETLAA